jgi:hypothetical protein
LARRSSCRHRRTSRHRRDGRDNIFTPNKGVLAAVAEAELRWNITPCWALIGFAGVGRTWGRFGSFSEADNETSKGRGFRDQLSRRLGLYAGRDYAWAPDDRVFYIQVGNAWR